MVFSKFIFYNGHATSSENIKSIHLVLPEYFHLVVLPFGYILPKSYLKDHGMFPSTRSYLNDLS